MRPVRATIDRAALAAAIERHGQQVHQWVATADYDQAARHQAMIQGLENMLLFSRGLAEVARVDVLLSIERNMAMVSETSRSSDYGKAARYQARATALVELLEIEDAGIPGGYDTARGQPSPMTARAERRLQMRIDWLKSLPVARPAAA